MGLTATRTQTPVDVSHLQEPTNATRQNTRGYVTLQQLLGDGYIEFSFDQGTAAALSAAAGISFAIYPHSTRSAMSGLHLIAFGFCVRGNENSAKIFVKALNTFIDTTLNYSPNIKMRVERIGAVVNFYTIDGNNAPVLRHSITNATPLPQASDFILVAGRNNCQIKSVFINGVTQRPQVIDTTKNVYIPLEGELVFNSLQPQLSVVTEGSEAVTWHFPDGTTSTDKLPNKNLASQVYTQLIRLEIPDGVTRIRELVIPCLRRDGRYAPPDLSALTNLRSLRIITRASASLVNGVTTQNFVALTSPFILPAACETFVTESIVDEAIVESRRTSPFIYSEELSFANLTQLRTLRLGFTQDFQSRYQAGFLAQTRFPNLTGCINLNSLVIDTQIFQTSTALHFLSAIPAAYLANCANLQTVTIQERNNTPPYSEAFINSLVVGVARAIAARTTPVLTLSIRIGTTFQTVTGTILSLAANAAAGANSIQLTATTGLNVGDRLLIEDGALNNLNNPLVIASITGSASPFTVTFQAGQTLINSYTAATGRVLNLESGLGSTRRLRLLGHTVNVLPATI